MAWSLRATMVPPLYRIPPEAIVRMAFAAHTARLPPPPPPPTLPPLFSPTTGGGLCTTSLVESVSASNGQGAPPAVAVPGMAATSEPSIRPCPIDPRPATHSASSIQTSSLSSSLFSSPHPSASATPRQSPPTSAETMAALPAMPLPLAASAAASSQDTTPSCDGSSHPQPTPSQPATHQFVSLAWQPACERADRPTQGHLAGAAAAAEATAQSERCYQERMARARSALHAQQRRAAAGDSSALMSGAAGAVAGGMGSVAGGVGSAAGVVAGLSRDAPALIPVASAARAAGVAEAPSGCSPLPEVVTQTPWRCLTVEVAGDAAMSESHHHHHLHHHPPNALPSNPPSTADGDGARGGASARAHAMSGAAESVRRIYAAGTDAQALLWFQALQELLCSLGQLEQPARPARLLWARARLRVALHAQRRGIPPQKLLVDAVHVSFGGSAHAGGTSLVDSAARRAQRAPHARARAHRGRSFAAGRPRRDAPRAASLIRTLAVALADPADAISRLVGCLWRLLAEPEV